MKAVSAPMDFVGQYDQRLEAFFTENRIFLDHPYRVAGVYKPGVAVKVDAAVRVERYAAMPPRTFVTMGAYSYCRSREIGPGIRIGRYCSIAENVSVLEPDLPTDWVVTRAFPFAPPPRAGAAAPDAPAAVPGGWPVIGDDVWIGQNVMIRRGVTIGSGAIVAAGSVVTEDVAPYMIVGGVEARPIRPRFPEPLIERMLAARWWRYNFADFGGLPIDQPEAFLDGLEARIAAGQIAPFEPGVIALAEALHALTATGA